MLKAGKGDCCIIEYEGKTILIDGGLKNTYNASLKKILKDKTSIDLIIITHIDNDHINGIVSIFEDRYFDLKKIKKVWFNSAAILNEKKDNDDRKIKLSSCSEEKGVSEGIFIESELENLGCWHTSPIKYGSSFTISDIKIDVLAPFDNELKELEENWEKEQKNIQLKKEEAQFKSSKIENNISINDLLKNQDLIDDSYTNKSSIAVLIEMNGKKLLFPGDTTSEILLKALKEKKYTKEFPLKLDIFKLPHHGSKFNINNDILEIIDCNTFLISTSGVGTSYHPDKECLAKIIAANKNKKIEFVFNYEIFDEMFLEEDRNEYKNFECVQKNEIEI